MRQRRERPSTLDVAVANDLGNACLGARASCPRGCSYLARAGCPRPQAGVPTRTFGLKTGPAALAPILGAALQSDGASFLSTSPKSEWSKLVNWTNAFQFRAPPRIVFGIGSASSVGDLARELGSTAPMVLTDPVLHRLGATEGVEQALREAGLRVEVFPGVVTEPTLASIESAVQAFRERGCDLIVAVGGGSSMDSAKAVSLLLGNEGKLTE